MPNSSRPTTNGKLLRNSTCLVYAPGPFVANAFERKCSIRNSPTGIIPVNECNRRSRNECPGPARKGATPPFRLTGDELTVEATSFLVSSKMRSELFIMLAREKGSQICVITVEVILTPQTWAPAGHPPRLSSASASPQSPPAHLAIPVRFGARTGAAHSTAYPEDLSGSLPQLLG